MKQIGNTKQEWHKKVWGSEHWVCNCPKYCSKFLTLNKNCFCSIHKHKIKDEHFLITYGVVLMQLGKEANRSIRMEKGDSIHIKPGMYHRFFGVTKAGILETSTKHRENDSYRVMESGRLKNGQELRCR